MGFFLGLMMDLILFSTNYRKRGYYLNSVIVAALVPTMLLFLIALGFPEAEKISPLFLPLLAIFFIESLTGIYLARLTYKQKLKNNYLIKQISS